MSFSLSVFIEFCPSIFDISDLSSLIRGQIRLNVSDVNLELLMRAREFYLNSLREKIFNDLLMLPHFRERLYEMSFQDRAFYTSGLDSSSLLMGESEWFYNVLELVRVVYQYLMGCLNRRGTKSYSSGCLDFRDIYVSIVLFQGAYVWIKFRQAARSGCLKRKSCETQDVQVRDGSDLEGVYVRAMKDKSGTVTHYKYEPRFKPPREKLDSGTTQKFNCLSLGQYNTPGEAKIVRQIAAFYYGKDEGWVVLEDGSSFSIPPMSEPEECFSGVEKAKWVTWKAKKVFADLRKEKVKSKQLRRATRTGSHFGPHGSNTESELSPFAATCSFPTPSRSADEHSDFPLVALVEPAASPGGSGAEQLVDSVPGDTTSEPIPAVEHFSDVNCSGVNYNVPAKDNDIAPESDDHGTEISGHAGDYSETDSGIEDMIAELIFGCAHVSPQRDDQIYHLGVSKIPGDYSLPEVNGFELVEPELSPNLNSQQGWDVIGAVSENIVASGSSFFFKERDPVLGQVNHLQQLLSRQKKLLEDSAIRYVDLQHQLSESEVKNSELQREKSELQQENERLRAMLQQVAKPQVATWSGLIIDFQREEGR